MIKRYYEFLKESVLNKRENFNSLGEWVEYLYENLKEDRLEYIKNIVTRNFNIKGDDLSDIKSYIRLSNAINILDDKIKEEIETLLKDYLENGLSNDDIVINTSTDLENINESEITKAGKGIFHSFLKTLTALGQKDKDHDIENCPSNFLLYYLYENLESDSVKSIFSRFKSLTPYLEHIDYSKNNVNLYFGIKCDGELEYGISYDEHIQFGSFKLSKSVINWFNNLESKSAFSLKRELVNLSSNDIITLGRIKNDMAEYNPGYHEQKLKPKLKDKVFSFGYQGVGKWDNGSMDQGEFINLKSNFVNWLMSRNWSNKVLIHIKPGSYWLYIHLKLK